MPFRISRTTWVARKLLRKKKSTFLSVFYSHKKNRTISCLVESRDENCGGGDWVRSVSALYRRRSSFSGSSLSFLLSRPASSPSHASHLPISLPPLIQPFIRQGGRTEGGRVCGKLAAPLPPLGREALRSPRRMEYIFQEKPPMFVKRFYFQAILRV